MTTNKQIRALIRERVAELDTVIVADLAEEVMNHLLNDAEFLRQFAQENLGRSVRHIAYDLLSADRSWLRSGDRFFASLDALNAHEVNALSELELSDEQQVTRKRWLDNFLEYVQSSRVHLRLGDMTKSDLVDAAAKRSERGRQELKLATFFVKVADRLGEDETVRERWTEEELDALYHRTEVRVRVTAKEDKLTKVTARATGGTELAAD